jgi:hypothetical protein
MLLVSQNKEKVYSFGRAFNSLEYQEDIDHKGKKESVRHTIQVCDGCGEEIAEYETKDRCLQVLEDFCKEYKNECYTIEKINPVTQIASTTIYHNNIVFEFPDK